MLILTVTAGVMAVSCGTNDKLETLNQQLEELNQQLDDLQGDTGVVGKIYDNVNEVDEPASFPGGDAGLNKFISANLEVPEDVVKGTVLVEIIINKAGTVINVALKNSLSPSCDVAVLKVFSILPNFNPAKIDGKPVSVKRIVPVRFRAAVIN